MIGAAKTRKAKDVAGNGNKLLLSNECFGNYIHEMIVTAAWTVL